MGRQPSNVDDFLDRLEYSRQRKQEIASARRGKGIYEDKPERQSVTTTSRFNRRKLGDWQDGYFDALDID